MTTDLLPHDRHFVRDQLEAEHCKALDPFGEPGSVSREIGAELLEETKRGRALEETEWRWDRGEDV